MKTVPAILLSLVGSVHSAPALVWTRNVKQGPGTQRTSKAVKAADILADVLRIDAEESSLASVVFVLGRDSDGSESLSALAAAGDLPKVHEKYNTADAIHHHVSGIESSASIERAAALVGVGHTVLSVNLSDLDSRLSSRREQKEVDISQTGLMSKTQKHAHQRAQDLSDATVLIVAVDPRVETSKLDDAIVRSIENEAVSSVVLTAVRSHAEVKHERLMEHNRRLSMMKDAGGRMHGRRLEDQQQQEEDNKDEKKADDDMTGVYYVSMTPNILAGILFITLFIVITWIGVSCMGMIEGQDVYVNKVPLVGREA